MKKDAKPKRKYAASAKVLDDAFEWADFNDEKDDLATSYMALCSFIGSGLDNPFPQSTVCDSLKIGFEDKHQAIYSSALLEHRSLREAAFHARDAMARVIAAHVKVTAKKGGDA